LLILKAHGKLPRASPVDAILRSHHTLQTVFQGDVAGPICGVR
jgi:hypothetical protein